MARQNRLHLYGFVESEPRIYKREDGELLQARLVIDVMRRYTEVDGRMVKPRHDHPLVITFDKKMIQEISLLGELDIVEIEAVITTRPAIKKSFCTACKAKHEEKGLFGYITPLSIIKRGEAESVKAANEELMRYNEISNRAEIIGTICKDPEFHEENGFATCQYPLAVNRNLRIKEDDPTNRTDYPWVKSFADQARSDSKLPLGATLLIDGSVQTRQIDRTSVCIFCGSEFIWKETITEIYPYRVEYLFNNRGAKVFSLGTLLPHIPATTKLIIYIDCLESDDNGVFLKDEIDNSLYGYEVLNVLPGIDGDSITLIIKAAKEDKDASDINLEDTELYPESNGLLE